MELPSAPRINPSILAADFVNMQRDLAKIATADFAHVDVMAVSYTHLTLPTTPYV